jgi:hypothetical protein
MHPDDPDAGTIGNHGHEGQLCVDGLADPPPVVKPKRGRPRCTEEPLGSISVWLPTTAQDRIIRLASQRRQTVSEYLRDVLLQLFMNRS